jgi:hypothetical protein
MPKPIISDYLLEYVCGIFGYGGLKLHLCQVPVVVCGGSNGKIRVCQQCL